MPNELRIDEEFRSLCPPLTEDEKRRLTESIQQLGVRDPVTTWNDTIVDGYHRHDICRQLGIPCPSRKIAFADRQAAKKWIIENQLARRNLTDIQRAYLIGQEYHAIKQPCGGRKEDRPNGSSKRAVGRKHGIAHMTVARHATFSKAVDSLPESCRAMVLDPSFVGRACHVVDLAAIGDESKIRKALEMSRDGVPLRDAIVRVTAKKQDVSICVACHAEKPFGKPCPRCEENRAARQRLPDAVNRAKVQIEAEQTSFDGWQDRLREMRRSGAGNDDLTFWANYVLMWLEEHDEPTEFHIETIERLIDKCRLYLARHETAVA